jgi:phospholipid/cholesterol/gamma-HCH transport system substrate-binding protein
MKFSMRFADQIVGALIVAALGALVFVVFMLGSSQRWFSRDYVFKTYFGSAAGLSKNMNVLYKGFTIGKVKSFDLADDDRVEVEFTVFDTYISRVRRGAMVEVLQNPIGLGSQFLFYPGLGAQVAEGEIIPAIHSPEGKDLLALGMTLVPEHDDTISLIVNRVNGVLDTLDGVLTQLDEAFAGTDQTSLGRTMGNVELAAGNLQETAAALSESLDAVLGQVEPILADLRLLSGKMTDPGGTVSAILDSDGAVYTNLIDSLESISGTLRNLERTSEFIPAQLPQVAALVSELRTALGTAEDVLLALSNNPLLKKGIPQKLETRTGGTSPRDISF